MVKSSDVVLILVAIIFPPAAAAFIAGCSCDLLINICLTVLGYIPGHLVSNFVRRVTKTCYNHSNSQHAFYLIYKKMQAEERYGYGGYLYVGNGHYEPLQPGQPQAPFYGATHQG
ncbi:hypothetical protein HGRIS_000499 [Hohenbuehelia grisea]|uniref:Uncharacterized protein n=1 Tax=Hohenbuehelia grisea TaxID=104357 RepID=A0ABR3JS59_9AGAR